MNNQLVVSGKAVSLVKPNGIRYFVAEKCGLEVQEKETFKSLKERAIASGATKADLQVWGKEYDSIRSDYYVQSNLINGQLAADPTLRKAVKINLNKKGEAIGATTIYRREKSNTLSLKAEVTQLRALVAKLQGTPALTA